MSLLCNKADCTSKCKSAGHCSELVAALSSGASESTALAWIARHCHNPGRTKDKMGRSLVHIATSTGSLKVLQWLLSYKDGQLNGKDIESGYSPLHRAIFHGQLEAVVFLIKNGSNLALVDHDGMTAFDHAVLDRPLHVSYERHALLDAYVWGTNSNYNLGLGSNTSRSNPDLLEQIRKEGTNVSKVDLQKFHSAFVTKSGTVFTCGHGRGGRLGHGSETMQLVPRPVQLSSSCVDVALGVDHTIFLAEGGIVHTCGMNTFHQLGLYPPPSILLAPAPITPRGTTKHPSALGVAAARFHSLFWSSDSVYTWGLNAGQLGHMKGEKTVIQPKLVASLAGKENKINMVVASDGASVVLTCKGDVVALYEYTSKKLGQRQHNVARLSVCGGNLDPLAGSGLGDSSEIDFKLVAGGGSSLKVVVLSITGRISVWEEKRDNSFIPCMFSLSREVIVSDIALFKDGMLIVSKRGEAWHGIHQAHNKRPQSPVNQRSGSISVPQCDLIKLKRIQHIHRAVAASCDAKGKNFCILQVCPNEALTEVPEIDPSSMIKDMKTLLADVNEFDDLHDVICIVGNQNFAAHSFILASGSETFSKQLRFTEVTGPVTVEIDDVHPEIFKQILQFLYYKSCELFMEGPCPIGPIKMVEKNDTLQEILEINGNSRDKSAFAVYSENKTKKKKNTKRNEKDIIRKPKTSNPLVLLQEAVKSLGIYGMSKAIECFKLEDGVVIRKSCPPRMKVEFCSKNFDEFKDVTICCEGEIEIYAHKCILTSRSEYFYSMFRSSWTESCSIINIPLPVLTVQTVVDYLYRDESAQVSRSEDIEFVSNILVVADQFLLTRLKQICEGQLTKLLTLKNVAEILQFSFNYSAVQLQKSSMQFICLNLPALLENRTLEMLDAEAFANLNRFYRNSNPVFSKRRIRPVHDGFPSQMKIEEEYLANPLSFEELEAAEEEAKLTIRSRNRRHSSGDKKSDLKSHRGRLNSSDSYSSGSDNDEEPEDKLSLCDFQIEENDVEETPPLPTSPIESKADKSFFSSILSEPIVENETPVTKDKRKPQKMSQKERKRLSLETANLKAKTDEVVSPKSTWAGWAAASPDKMSSSPSLVDIMRMEGKPAQDSRINSKTPSSEEKRLRNMSESEKKIDKKTSWRKMELNPTDAEKAIASVVSTPPSNPWKILDNSNNKVEHPTLLSPRKTSDDSFQQIMNDDVEQKKNLFKVQSKPLYVTQIEEKAIEELNSFYNTSFVAEEIITVSRVESGAVSTPVWKKF